MRALVASWHLLILATTCWACAPPPSAAIQGPSRTWRVSEPRGTSGSSSAEGGYDSTGLARPGDQRGPRPFAPIIVPELLPRDASGCLETLEAEGVPFEPLSQLRGVETPVTVTGRLGGVDYWVHGGGSLEMDCRLAVTLAALESLFARHGVRRIRYSGAYVYKTTSSGRLSHHAHGLALDIHEIDLGGQTLSVEDDFRRGLGCSGELPPLNTLACELEATGVFDEFLTPDYNQAHRDHLHVSVRRLPHQVAGRTNASASNAPVNEARR